MADLGATREENRALRERVRELEAAGSACAAVLREAAEWTAESETDPAEIQERAQVAVLAWEALAGIPERQEP